MVFGHNLFHTEATTPNFNRHLPAYSPHRPLQLSCQVADISRLQNLFSEDG